MFQFKRIRTKLVFWFLVLGLVPLSLGITINYLQRLNTMKETGYKRLMAVRDSKAEQLEYWLSNRSTEVSSVAKMPELIDALLQLKSIPNSSIDPVFFEDVDRLLKKCQLKYPEMLAIQVFKVDNEKLKALGGDSANELSKPRARALKKALTTGVTNFSEVFNMPAYRAMAIAVPVFDAQHKDESEIIAVLEVTFNLQAVFDNLIKALPEMGETGEILLVNKDGVVLTDLSKIQITPLKYQVMTRQARLAQSGEEGIIQDRDYSGAPVLAAYTHLRVTHWGVIVKQDLREIDQPIRALLIDFGGLLIFSVILLVAMASVVAESISRPIIALAHHAKRIQKGNYSPNKLVAKDEIGILSDSYNEMVIYIQRQLNLQQGMTAISGSLVGSTSMNLFLIGLISSLSQVTKASTIIILTKTTDSSKAEYILKKYWPRIEKLNTIKDGWSFDDIQWMIHTQAKHFKMAASRFSECLGFDAASQQNLEFISVPLHREDDLAALILLVADDSFGKDALEIIEQTRSTINIGYSNAQTTDQMSILANSLFDINQQLEKKTDELICQSEQLKKSADELKKRNVELEVQRKEVESINRFKSEFLSNMSHELRTPLHVILTLSDVVKKQLIDQLKNTEEIEYLEVIDRNGQILLKLISDILDLSRIEAGRANPIIRPFPLVVLLQNIMSNIQTLAIEKGLQCTLVVKGEIPIINSDEEKLFQVFQNIIGNAIKFTHSGSVTIEVFAENQGVVVDIIDTGIGIPEDQFKSIFNEFVQVDASTTRNYQGTGLGLAIARKTIELLHGNISVKSRLGYGSSFTVRIPVTTPNGEGSGNNIAI